MFNTISIKSILMYLHYWSKNPRLDTNISGGHHAPLPSKTGAPWLARSFPCLWKFPRSRYACSWLPWAGKNLTRPHWLHQGRTFRKLQANFFYEGLNFLGTLSQRRLSLLGWATILAKTVLSLSSCRYSCVRKCSHWWSDHWRPPPPCWGTCWPPPTSPPWTWAAPSSLWIPSR